MSRTARADRLDSWGIPALYAGISVAAGFVFPRLENRFFPELVARVSTGTATAIYTSIASGMIALTGIVFSLTFLIVQFSSSAYSPRLVLWIARDRIISHALGIFTATFLYAIAALTGVDRSNSGRAPFISALVVIVLLLVSVGMFIGLIQRIGLLQVNRILIFTGDQGRRVIENLYPSNRPEMTNRGEDDLRKDPPGQSLSRKGRPQSIQTVDVDALVAVAEKFGALIEVTAGIGDTVVEAVPLLHIYGARHRIDERALWAAIELGEERTFDQDPKYSIRLLVDIAIRALSPAVNDPTTAVQALDQIEDLLIRLSRHFLEIGRFYDRDGRLRLIVPFPSWEDILRLAFDEIICYGGSSVQVMRRMNALVTDLSVTVPEGRRNALREWETRLKGVIGRSFVDEQDRLDASQSDRQGLGISREIEQSCRIA